MDEIIAALEQTVRARLINWPEGWEGYHWPGYTYEHTLRVRDLALELAARERADQQVVLLAALLHDIRKDSGKDHAQVGAEAAAEILADLGVNGSLQERVCHAIALHSGDNQPTSPSENLCLGDADLIDANFGVVAVWRFITIRAGHGHELPETIRAMEEWLPRKEVLLANPGMLTRSGREIARQRAARMQVFCEALIEAVRAGDGTGDAELVALAEHFHAARGERLLADQLDSLEAGSANGLAGIVCRSLRAEIAGKH